MKRFLDFTTAALALILLSPALVLLALLIRIKLGTPIFFTQERPGLNSVPFKMIKFRTMTNRTDADGKLLPDANRMTRFGNFLRKTSLDELPELWNVVTGKMSLVGPRPLLMEYLALYNQRQSRRHEVRPGITGWSQINGRNSLSWEQKFELDVWYVDNQSLKLDLEILIKTVGKVLLRKDISAEGEATMPRFSGNETEE